MQLKARAAEAGMSLSDYLLADLRKAAERPTPDELRERLRSRPAVTLLEAPLLTSDASLAAAKHRATIEVLAAP